MSTTMNEDVTLREMLMDICRQQPKKKKMILAACAVGVVLLLLIGIWAIGYGCANGKRAAEIERLNARIAELEETPTVVESIRPEIVQQVLSEKMSDIRELASAEYIFTNAARFTSSKHIKDWKIPLTQKSFVQKWDGVIKAGVDLEALQVTGDGEKLCITLPRAEVLSYEVLTDTVEVLDEKNNVFNPIKVDDKNDFDAETKQEMIDRAIKNGLLDKADKNAEQIITDIIVSTYRISKDRIEFVRTEK